MSQNHASLRPNSDHFHHLFSSTKPFSDAVNTVSDDFNEDDIFFSGADPPSPAPPSHRKPNFHLSTGVLAALTGSSDRNRLLQRKPSQPIPAIPRPEREVGIPVSQSAPARKFQHSAPVGVPMLEKRATRVFVNDDEDEDEECGGEERLPPHEIVARRYGGSAATSSFSVLEGVGRTLKGRDLRQVRNAVWQQTGFLD